MPRIPTPPRGPKKDIGRPKKTSKSDTQTVRSAEGRAMEKAKKKISATYSGSDLPARAKVKGGMGATKPRRSPSTGGTVRSAEGRAMEKISKAAKGPQYPPRATVKGGFGATKPRSSGSSARATGAEAKVARGSRAGSSARARGAETGGVRTPGYTTRGGNTGGFGKTAYKARGNAATVRSMEGRAKSKVKRKYS